LNIGGGQLHYSVDRFESKSNIADGPTDDRYKDLERWSAVYFEPVLRLKPNVVIDPRSWFL
jgi:hypothetical protein